MKQPYPQILFQRPDPFADKCSRHPELFGHRAETGALGHLEENIEVVEARKIIHVLLKKNKRDGGLSPRA